MAVVIKVGLHPVGDAVADVKPAPPLAPPAVPADAVADVSEDDAQPSKPTPKAGTVK